MLSLLRNLTEIGILKNIHDDESAAALLSQKKKNKIKIKIKERSLHKEMQIIVKKIPPYLEAMFYPHLLPSQMKTVTKILHL